MLDTGRDVVGADEPDDLLILTVDHGCDPTLCASVLRWLTGREAPELPGETFVPG